MVLQLPMLMLQLLMLQLPEQIDGSWEKGFAVAGKTILRLLGNDIAVAGKDIAATGKDVAAAGKYVAAARIFIFIFLGKREIQRRTAQGEFRLTGPIWSFSWRFPENF